MTIDQAEPPAAPSCDRCPHCKLVAEDPDGELRHSTRMSFEFEVYHDGDQAEFVVVMAERFEKVMYAAGADADCIGHTWEPVNRDRP